MTEHLNFSPSWKLKFNSCWQLLFLIHVAVTIFVDVFVRPRYFNAIPTHRVQEMTEPPVSSGSEGVAMATRPQSCVLLTVVDRMLDGAIVVAVLVFNATALFVFVEYIVPPTDTCTGTSRWFVGTTERVCFLR